MPPGTLKRIKPLHPNLVPPKGSEPVGTTDDNKNQLYSYSRKRSRNIPLYSCNECSNEYGVSGEDEHAHTSPCCDARGNRVWKTNRMTGEQVLKKNTYEIYEEHLLFYLESEGNGNVRMIQYEPMTEEERREREKQLMVEHEGPALIAAMLESGLTPGKIREWAQQGGDSAEASSGNGAGNGSGATEVPEPDAAPEPDTQTDERPSLAPDTDGYPVMHGPKMWYLSRQHEAAVDAGEAEAFKGLKKEAEEAVAGIESDFAEARETADAIPEL